MEIRFLINTKTRRIVYVEAGKEFVDLLFCILTMPIGYIAEFLSEWQSEKKVGSVTNLYEGREKLDKFFSSQSKYMWKLLDCTYKTTFSKDANLVGDGICFVCAESEQNSKMTHNMSVEAGLECCCGQTMEKLVELRDGSGYVKGTATFLITDDLKITWSSITNCRKILNQLNIKDLTDLQDRTAQIGRNEACKLVEASLVSTTVFTDVFGAELFQGLCP